MSLKQKLIRYCEEHGIFCSFCRKNIWNRANNFNVMINSSCKHANSALVTSCRVSNYKALYIRYFCLKLLFFVGRLPLSGSAHSFFRWMLLAFKAYRCTEDIAHVIGFWPSSTILRNPIFCWLSIYCVMGTLNGIGNKKFIVFIVKELLQPQVLHILFSSWDIVSRNNMLCVVFVRNFFVKFRKVSRQLKHPYITVVKEKHFKGSHYYTLLKAVAFCNFLLHVYMY